MGEQTRTCVTWSPQPTASSLGNLGESESGYAYCLRPTASRQARVCTTFRCEASAKFHERSCVPRLGRLRLEGKQGTRAILADPGDLELRLGGRCGAPRSHPRPSQAAR